MKDLSDISHVEAAIWERFTDLSSGFSNLAGFLPPLQTTYPKW